MNGVKPTTGWQTVKSRTEEKKKKQEEKRKEKQQAEQKKDRLGVTAKSDVFAVFDRVYQEEAAAAKPSKPQLHGDYKGAYAHLANEGPTAAGAASDSDASEEEPASSANGTSEAAAAAAAKTKKPKVKKPKIMFATIAESVDIPALQVKLGELQGRYATAPVSQLEMLSDTLLATFREVSLDLGRTLATRGLEQASEVPMRDVPQPLYNALSSAVAATPQAACAAVVVSLVAAILEGVPDTTSRPGQAPPPPPPRGKAGLLLMLALLLRVQPQALVLAVPGLRARLGVKGLTGGPRILHTLWVLQQAAATEPAVALAVWLRLLLPMILGAPDLPSSSSIKAKGGSDAPAGSAGAAPGVMEEAGAQVALSYVRELLRGLGPGATPEVVFEGGGAEATVPGGAVELIARVAAGLPASPSSAAQQPQQQAQGGKKGGSKGASGPSAAVLGEVGVLLEPLRVLAGAGVRAVGPAEWLPLALETASLSSAAPEAPDALVVGAARSVVTCLAGGGSGAAALWESKHKASLKGSGRVLVVLAQQPALLGPALQGKAAHLYLKQLFAALPARHRSHLANGKGWQLACARAAEGACATLSRRLGGGWGAGRSRGSGGAGSGLMSALGLVGGVAALAGVLVTAAAHRREVGGLLTHYAGAEVASKVDGLLLQPLSEVVAAASAAAAPHLAAAQEVVGPYWEQATAAAEPHLAAAAAAVGPHLEAAQVALAPHLAAAQAALAPLVAQAEALQAAVLGQLEEIWQRAKQG